MVLPAFKARTGSSSSCVFVFFFNLFYLVFFLLCWVFIAALMRSLVAGIGGYTLGCPQASRCGGFSYRGAHSPGRASGCGAQASAVG